MTTIKTLAKALLGLALAATVGVAKADLTNDYYHEWEYKLEAAWTLDADPAPPGDWSFHRDGTWWDTDLDAWGVAVINVSGNDILSAAATTLTSRHAAKPHETTVGPLFWNVTLGITFGSTPTQITDRSMRQHQAGLLHYWQPFPDTPTGWNTPLHYDHYEWKVDAHSDGTAKLYLTAIHPPVPEPETYAMLLAGLGVIGAIARRRKVSAG